MGDDIAPEPPRPRFHWWKPGMHHATRRNVAGAGVTGLLVARDAGARGLVAALSAAVALSFVVVLIVLKVAVH